jgi:hypothetical protein
MKKLLLLLPLLLFSGFISNTNYLPILMDRSELNKSVQLINSAKSLTAPGKICLYQDWILLVEKYKGVHLIDNHDPSNPVRKAFLKVPGCLDVAVRNGVLYADNAVDLVAVRLDLEQMKATEISRKAYALPEIASPEGYIPNEFTRAKRPVGTEIVGWIPNSNAPKYY